MITSMQNPKIQWVRKLISLRKEREAEKAFVIEGVRLVEESLKVDWGPITILFSSELSPRGKELLERAQNRKCEILEISPELMARVTDTEAPQGILAVLPFKQLNFPRAVNFLLVLDEIRDPGNLGTILRTAEAAGVQGVILAPGTVEVFSPKVLRAGMGAQFRLPLRSMGWDEINKTFKPALKFFLAESEAKISCWKADLTMPLALVIGGEAEGASAAARAGVDELIRIPMPGNAESLNAGMAASILIFEVVRQRTQ